MEQQQPPPPELERPWYYQNWFLMGSFIMGWPVSYPFVLWPVWGILILRSPWHTGTLLRGLGLAMLIVGSWLMIKNFQASFNGDEDSPEVFFVVMLLFPGILVTIITQVMWARFREENGLVIRPAPPLPETPPDDTDLPEDMDSPDFPDTPEDAFTRRTRLRRRIQQRRSDKGDSARRR